jgi:hypothetical protein
MKILNATAWRTEDLAAVVGRAEQEAKTETNETHNITVIYFKPTSRPFMRFRIQGQGHGNHSLLVPMCQPIKLKNKLDALTKIAANIGGYAMEGEMAAHLLLCLKNSFGVQYGGSNYYSRLDFKKFVETVTDPPVIRERLAEEGRRDAATIDLGEMLLRREKARLKWEEDDLDFANTIEKLERTIDLNNNRLEKKRRESIKSGRPHPPVS